MQSEPFHMLLDVTEEYLNGQVEFNDLYAFLANIHDHDVDTATFQCAIVIAQILDAAMVGVISVEHTNSELQQVVDYMNKEAQIEYGGY